MKKLFKLQIIIIVVAMIVTISCKKESDTETDPTPTTPTDEWSDLNPTTTQKGIIINYTANWCGPCGSWGVPLMKSVVSMGNVIGYGVKASGDPNYNSVLYSSFNADRAVGPGIPNFWMNDVETTSESSMTNFLQNTVPTISVDMKHIYEGDSMVVYSAVKTLDGFVAGDYYLSIVVLEDSLKYSQNGITDPNYTHTYVTRTAYDNKAYGVPITIIAGGEKNKFKHKIAIKSTWVKNNCYAAVALYKKEGTTKPIYKFKNADWSRPAAK